MSFRIFSLGLACSFLLPWLLVIVLPAVSMQRVEAVRFNHRCLAPLDGHDPSAASLLAVDYGAFSFLSSAVTTAKAARSSTSASLWT